MSDQDPGQNNQGGNRNGRRRRRRRNGQGGAPQDGARANNGANMDQNRRRRRRRRDGKPDGQGGSPRRPHKAIDPFDVFAAYHLGLGENKRFRPVGVREVARRFNIGQNDLLEVLNLYSMDSSSMAKMRGKFEVSWARQDIKAIPEGMDREAIARDRFQDFVDCGIEVGLFEEGPTIDLMQVRIDEADARDAREAQARREESQEEQQVEEEEEDHDAEVEEDLDGDDHEDDDDDADASA